MSGNYNEATCDDCGWRCPDHRSSDPGDDGNGTNCATCNWTCQHDQESGSQGYCDHCGWKCLVHNFDWGDTCEYCGGVRLE